MRTAVACAFAQCRFAALMGQSLDIAFFPFLHVNSFPQIAIAGGRHCCPSDGIDDCQLPEEASMNISALVILEQFFDRSHA